mmetsp:Transcript_16601/g.41052  ORF Transcript_16601/g.41052 Transcript_16601/m.41052 type:complete len:291 (+) Transcript_16601:204-1076(+)|eukprot:CAMPEP_0179006712 /NCGR_PEP_ID=MMETSP0795-20121207/14718_1 /TAXON_ID=88552 /ORGANISM="Amoebophrya sp., Strain Ameob2" /LENGTH=290 /DNA_ID=CAMNT_0020701527 /DNA_START=137 /DNA_END=1009 /DNA_ORIENTATION=-
MPEDGATVTFDVAEEEEEIAEGPDVRPKFIPRGYEKLNKHIYRNIFYSTSTADSFRDPIEYSKDTPELHRDCRGTNVQGIHDINRSGKFKPSRAPLYQRSMCAYTQQFVPRPLDGVQINKECYDLFKEKCETPSTSSGGKGAIFHGETTTAASFPQYSRTLSEKAIAPNFKPAQAKHVSDENKMLVKQSFQHKEYPCPTPDATKNARPAAFKPAYKTHKAVGTMSAVSSYNREYHADKYNSVWPVRFARQNAPPPPASGYTGKQRLDPESPRKLKEEDFRIGDVVGYGPC